MCLISSASTTTSSSHLESGSIGSRQISRAAPHVVEDEGRQFWVYEDQRPPTMGLNAVAGNPREQWQNEPVRFSDMIPGCYDPVERAKDMRPEGIFASVNFPSLPRFAGTLFLEFKDKELAQTLRARLERFRHRRVVPGGAGALRPDGHSAALGSAAGRGRDPSAASTRGLEPFRSSRIRHR